MIDRPEKCRTMAWRPPVPTCCLQVLTLIRLRGELVCHRLLEPLGYVPPAEAEENYYRRLSEQTMSV
jgi:hypothetical protein